MAKCHSFYRVSNILLCVCVLHLYPFFRLWTFRLLPYLAVVDNALWTLGCMYLFRLMFSFSLCGYIPRSTIAGSCGSSIFSFLRKLSSIFHSGCTYLCFHQQYMRIPFSLRSHQCLLLVLFLMIIILTGVMWLSLCSFNLHSSDDWEWLASFYLPVDHLYIFFGKMSIQVFWPF